MTQTIEMTIGDYDRVRPIRLGTVSSDKLELSVDTQRPGKTFPQVTGGADFELTEMSLSTFTMWQARGDCPYVGLPVFPSRFFRHSAIYVNPRSDIEVPADLKGGDIGLFTEYQMTAATTIRGMFQHEHDVYPDDVSWYSVREEKLPIDLPEGVDVEVIGDDQDVFELLLAEELDALISPRIPSDLGSGIERMFTDFEVAEQEYFRRNHVFPIMHLLVLHRDIYLERPDIVYEIYDVMERAKEQAIERLYHGGALYVTLPWLLAHVENTHNVLGRDFWPYGFEENEQELRMFTRYSFEQGLSSRRRDPSDLFVPELLDT